MKMEAIKVTILDENVKFPSCPVCDRQLSPYAMEENTILPRIKVALAKRRLIYSRDKKYLIVFICPDCCNIKRKKK